MKRLGRPPGLQIETLRKRLETVKVRKIVRSQEGIGRKTTAPFTPSEMLFEIQLKARGFIEVDIALRTTDPFKYERHVIGQPTRIRGLEPGEIMKLRRDLQGFLVWWRGQLALERQDQSVVSRMEIEDEDDKREGKVCEVSDEA